MIKLQSVGVDKQNSSSTVLVPTEEVASLLRAKNAQIGEENFISLTIFYKNFFNKRLEEKHLLGVEEIGFFLDCPEIFENLHGSFYSTRILFAFDKFLRNCHKEEFREFAHLQELLDKEKCLTIDEAKSLLTQFVEGPCYNLCKLNGYWTKWLLEQNVDLIKLLFRKVDVQGSTLDERKREEIGTQRILVAQDFEAEAEIICEKIKNCLPSFKNIAIVVPESHVVLRNRIRCKLDCLKIGVFDAKPERGTDHYCEVLYEWLNLQEEFNLDGFVDLLGGLQSMGAISLEEYRTIFDEFSSAFNSCLTDDLNVLLSFVKLHCSDKLKKCSVAKNIVDGLIPLPELACGKEFFDILEGFASKLACINEIWSKVKRSANLKQSSAAFKLSFKKETFCTYLKCLLKKCTADKSIKNDCKVYLLSPYLACNEQWDALIIAGLNKNFWQKSDPLAWPLSEFDAYDFESNKELLKSLVSSYKCILLTAAQKDCGLEELTLSCIVPHVAEYVDHDADYCLKNVNEFSALNDIEQTHLAYCNRQDDQLPFNDYSFCVNKEITLSCSAWERVFLSPSLAWFDNVLRAFKIKNFAELDEKSKSIGVWAHEWLSVCEEADCTQNLKDKVILRAKLFFEKIEKAYNKNSNEVPDWWIQSWQRALDLALTIIETQGEEWFEHWKSRHCERNIPRSKVTLPFTNNSINLTGRIDLLLSSSHIDKAINGGIELSDIEVVDFKTGAKFPFTENQLAKGKGLQLVLYALGLQKFSKGEVKFSIIFKDGSKKTYCLSEVLEKLSPLFQKWSKMFEYGSIFALPKEDEKASLPLATLAVKDDVQTKKCVI